MAKTNKIIQYGADLYDKFLAMREKGAVDRAHFVEVAGKNPTRRDELYARKTGEVDAQAGASIYSNSPLAFSQVRIIADLLSCVPLKLYHEQRGGKVVERRTGYPYKITEFVNPNMGMSLLLRHTVSWLKITGDHYWALEESPPEFQDISRWCLFPLNPIRTRIKPDPDTGVAGYVYDVAGERIWFPHNRVIHFRNFSPFDYHHGHSEFNPLTYDMQVERFAKRQLRNYFYNANVVDGVISIDEELEDDEVRKLKRQFKEQHEGSRNAHRIMVLTKGMSYTPVNASQPEQTVDGLLSGTVANAHASVLGVPTAVMNGEGADLNASKALMWEQSILPMGRLIEEPLTRFARTMMPGLHYAFDYSNVMALRLHDLDRARVEVAHENGGLRTPNELRAERGLDPYTGDLEEFGNTPLPVWNAKQAEAMARQQAAARLGQGGTTNSQSSPSLTLPGSLGGRDQSVEGEAQMADETGTR